jgi:hypothetical protein
MLEKEDEYSAYRIDDVKRINIRYYLIKIDGKSYIIDYANPKDLKTYFPIAFPRMNQEWRIYDVTSNEQKYNAKWLPFYQRPKYIRLLALSVISYLINIRYFPPSLNFRYLMMDKRIVEHWYVSLCVILLGAFAIFMWLYTRPTEIELPKASQWLVREYPLSKISLIVLSLVVFPFLNIAGLFLGIVSSNYVQLFVFGIFPFYSFLFTRFSDAIRTRPTDLYEIMTEEEN